MTQDLDIYMAKQACTDLVYKVARGVDRCDRELLLAVFHPDATDDHGQFKGTAAEFVDWVLPVVATMDRTQHFIGNVLVDVSGDQAWGESYFIANHDMKASDGSPIRYVVSGRYLDRFERRDGEWKIAHRGCVFDWNATHPQTDAWDRVDGPRRYGQRGTNDPVYAEGMAPSKIKDEV